MALPSCIYCPSRTKNDDHICGQCRRNHGDIGMGMPPGQWVGGLVKRFVPDVPEWHPRIVPLGVTCACGCLLAHADERCPACLVWAELDAARWSWHALGIGNFDTEMEAA